MALLSDVVAHSRHVPSSHVRVVGDRPDLANVDHESGASIPVIDLEHLDGPGRGSVVEAIGLLHGDKSRHPEVGHGGDAARDKGVLPLAGVGAAQVLLRRPQEAHPADALADCHSLAYRPFTYQEYDQEYWKTGLDSASCLNK